MRTLAHIVSKLAPTYWLPLSVLFEGPLSDGSHGFVVVDVLATVVECSLVEVVVMGPWPHAVLYILCVAVAVRLLLPAEPISGASTH